MDSTSAPPDEPIEKNETKFGEKEVNMARIEAMVTPEQVFSATVARKRRTFTKKRSTSLSKTRDQTPLKEIDDKLTTTDEEQPKEQMSPRPKTPERRRRKRTPGKSMEKGSKSEPEFTEPELDREEQRRKTVTVKKSNSIPRQLVTSEVPSRRGENLADMAQAEVMAFFNKTKKSLTAAANRGRDRFKKVDKELVKRSQSAPYAFTEEELIESFRKAQLLDQSQQNLTAPRDMRRDYSDSSIMSMVTPEKPLVPRPFRPEVQEFVKQRKKLRTPSKRIYSTKIVEILDPKTSKLMCSRAIVRPDFKLRHLFSVLTSFTISELITHYRIFKQDMKNEYKRIRRLRNKCLIELFLILLLCGLGGFVFKFVEGHFEHFYKCGVKRVKRDFIDLLWVKSHSLREEEWKSLARNRLWKFEEELHTAHEAGVKSYSGQQSWSFLNSMLYCLTIITTIGYGHIVPSTTTGQALTIVYAIIGIPLFLIALTDFGKLFTRGIKFVWSYVRRVYYTGSCRKVRKNTGVEGIFKGAQMMYDIATFRKSFSDPEIPVPPATEDVAADGTTTDGTPTTPAISNFEIDDEFNLPITLAIIILIIYIFLGSVGYMLIEEWEFARSFYFVFISMSTIGFGDLVPKNPICLILSIVYLVFGLALTSMCINVVQAKLSDTFKQASSKIGATIGINVDEEEEGVEGVGEDGVPGNDKGDAGDVRVGEESDKPSDKPETSKGKENLASPEDTSSDMVRSESNGTTKSS